MSINPLEQHIKRISEKLQQLLKQHQLLQKENDQLRRELQYIRSLDTDRAKQLTELEQKVAVLKTATNNMDETDKKELEKRLNHYIKEIDRCITMLGE